MRTDRIIHTVESHTEGMPTRVVVGGVGTVAGTTMAERRRRFIDAKDDLRTFLMNEPRGHNAMSGAILQPPTRPDADYGVLFIEVSGCLPMCGHGTIGVATVLVETGMLDVVEPVTTIGLDTPAGLVTAEVSVEAGKATAVTIQNVASFVERFDATVDVPGHGTVTYDLAFGGNFYAIVDTDQLGLRVDAEAKDDLLRAGLDIMAAINATDPPRHPENADIDVCHHVQLVDPSSTPVHSRHAMAIHPGWFDRSPCGTGTSARLAQLVGRGEFGIGDELVNESIIGSQFVGRVVEHTTVGGVPAVIPTITGRAWITGTAQYVLDPTDPFPAGFRL